VETEPETQATQGKRKLRLRRPALIARLPKLWWTPGEDWPVVPSKSKRTPYPTLGTDLALWDGRLEQRFRDLDHLALKLQNRFWRLQLTLIFGSAVASILGAIQAATGGGHTWLAVAGAVLGGLLAGVSVLVRDRRAQRGYLTARLKAERIKSEYFLFLARAGEYRDDADGALLLARIAEIEQAEAVA
jgi:hypothetical protein